MAVEAPYRHQNMKTQFDEKNIPSKKTMRRVDICS